MTSVDTTREERDRERERWMQDINYNLFLIMQTFIKELLEKAAKIKPGIAS